MTDTATPAKRTRIDTLTDAERATFPGYVDRWTATGLRTGPLNADEWAQVEAAARRMYGYAGLPEPRVFLGVASPLAAAIAASVAAEVAPAAAAHLGDGVEAGVWDGVGDGVGDGVEAGVRVGVRAGVEDGVRVGVRAGVGAGVWDGVEAGVWDGVGDGVEAGVRVGVRDGVGDGVRVGVRDGVGDGVEAGVGAGVEAGVRAGVRDGVEAGVEAGVRAGVRDGVRAGVEDGVWAGVGDGVEDGVRAGVRDGVGAGVRDGVGAGVWDGVGAGVWDGVGAGVWAGVRAGVRAGVEAGVEAGVSLLAPYQEWLHEPIRRGLSKVRTQWYAQYRGGNLWCSSNAWATWFRDHGLDLGDDLWNRLDADNTMCLAGPSWWFGGHCIVSDRPTELHVENVAGVNRLHCGTGTAIAWADGWGIYSWHGVQVPADLIEDGWPIDRIMREENAEVRRCAVEILADRDGWAGIIRAAGWQQIGADAPDPGNPGQRLSLYRVPALTDRRGVGMGLYREPVNLLRCTNATVERSGERHEFGLTVPADITDPTEASAWTFDLPVDLYRALQRAC